MMIIKLNFYRHKQTHHTKEIRVFSVFQKCYQAKRRKIQHQCIQNYIMHTKSNILHAKKIFFKKCLLAYKNQLAIQKINKIFLWGGGNFEITWENFVSPSKKNASHTISIYGNCMISLLYNKNLRK